MAKFFGKYRGKVEVNEDPLKLGRVQVSVPSVLGEGTSSWAMPCVPYAGDGVGLYLIPPVGANVWVEFEAGETNFPIWTGCFWGEGELPVDPPKPDTKAFVTEGVNLTIEAKSGGKLSLEVSSPVVDTAVTVVIDGAGLKMETGSCTVELTSSKVAINGDALEVT
jgi:hypothetical protein